MHYILLFVAIVIVIAEYVIMFWKYKNEKPLSTSFFVILSAIAILFCAIFNLIVICL